MERIDDLVELYSSLPHGGARNEVALFEKYTDCSSYAFFVMRKP